MLAGAGEDWEVLVVGYVSRFARDLRTVVNARHDLHARGAVILFAGDPVYRGHAPFTARAFLNALWFGGYGAGEEN